MSDLVFILDLVFTLAFHVPSHLPLAWAKNDVETGLDGEEAGTRQWLLAREVGEISTY